MNRYDTLNIVLTILFTMGVAYYDSWMSASAGFAAISAYFIKKYYAEKAKRYLVFVFVIASVWSVGFLIQYLS